MQTPQPDNSEPDNDTDTSTPDRDPSAPETRLGQVTKQLGLARERLDDLDINKHSRKRIEREIDEAAESAKTALDVLENTDATEVGSDV